MPPEEEIPQSARRRSTRARAGRVLGLAVTVAATGLWSGWLRPQSLGGRVGYVIVSGRSMLPAMKGGDLALVRRQDRYGVGDVVSYRIPDGDEFAGRRIIHRIIGGDGTTGFVLRGDGNLEADRWKPRPGDIDGKLWRLLPGVGRAVAVIRSPSVVAAGAGALAFALTLTWQPKRPGRRASGPGPTGVGRPSTAAGGPSWPS